MQSNRGTGLKCAIALVAAAAIVLSTSCKQSQPRGEVTGNASLIGAGSTFSSVLFKKWFETYHGLYPDITVSYDVVGSGEGVRRFIGKNVKKEDAVDFGASDAALQDNVLAQVSEGALMIPITAGGVVLAYNLSDLNGELKLSREAYSGIFLGKITRWDDPRIAATNRSLNLPHQSIMPVVREDSSGTTFAFTNHLNAISGEWHDKYGASKLLDWPCKPMRANGNEGVAGKIQHSIGSIGYIEYQFSRRLDLKTATLENREGKYVRPTEQAVIAGLSSANFPDNLRVFVPDPSGAASYPIVTYSWVLVRKNNPDQTKAKMLRELFTWCLLDGQHYSSTLGYVPLPPTVADKSLAAVQRLSVKQ